MERIAGLRLDAWCFSLDSFVAIDRTWEIHTSPDGAYELSKRHLTDLWQICALVFPYEMPFISQANNNALYPIRALFFNYELFGSAVLCGVSLPPVSEQLCALCGTGGTSQAWLTPPGCGGDLQYACGFELVGVGRERSLACVKCTPCLVYPLEGASDRSLPWRRRCLRLSWSRASVWGLSITGEATVKRFSLVESVIGIQGPGFQASWRENFGITDLIQSSVGQQHRQQVLGHWRVLLKLSWKELFCQRAMLKKTTHWLYIAQFLPCH